ncbi:MAG: hypothetical protein AAFS11_08635, partial [Planctomycetota bacterium]
VRGTGADAETRTQLTAFMRYSGQGWEIPVPLEHNFRHEPIVKHGPYDFESVVPPGCDEKDFPLPPKDEVRTIH